MNSTVIAAGPILARGGQWGSKTRLQAGEGEPGAEGKGGGANGGSGSSQQQQQFTMSHHGMLPLLLRRRRQV